MLAQLKASGKIKTFASGASTDDEEFDLLIVGGGATGAGCAVDAATRGLKVAMVDRDDFSAGALLFSRPKGLGAHSVPLPCRDFVQID